MRKAALAIGLMMALPTAAWTEERDFCADRPGLGAPACTLDPGRVQIEMGGADFTHDHNAGGTEDTLLLADTLVRIGLGETTEAYIGWTPFGHVRTKDSATGAVSHASRVGDVTLGVRQNLHNPDGSGTSFALMPFVSLPLGRAPVGAGDWGAGLVLPVSFDLTDALHIALTPEMDAAVDGDGKGRHLAYGSVFGLGIDLSDAVGLSVEIGATRDRDPEGHATQVNASLSLAWQRGKDMAFDVGAVAGLNRNTPDAEIYVGVARRF